MNNNTLYKFYSDECQPCKQLSVIMDNIDIAVPIESINVYEEGNMKLVKACGVRAVPTLVFIDTDGNPHTKTGMMNKESLQKWLDSVREVV